MGENYNCGCAFILCILCLIITLLIFKKLQFISSNSTTLNLPPSPPSLPFIGHLHLLSPALFKSFHNLSLKHGELLYLRLGATPCLLVSSASAATDIFNTNDLAFAYRPVFAFADKISYIPAGFINAPYGDYWRFIKNLTVMELLSPRQIERYRKIRREERHKFLQRIFECWKQRRAVDVGAEIMKLTNNVICRTAMTTRCSEGDYQAEQCRMLVKQIFKLAAKLCFGDVLGPFKWLTFWMYGKQSANLTKQFDDLLEEVLKEHEDRAEKEVGGADERDIMDILLKIHQDEKARVRVTRTNIKALLVDLFIAGTDTTADAMQWALAELINHPDIFRKVRDEIETVVNGSRLVEESDVQNLPYLQAVVKETLRLHPPAPVTTRECHHHCKVAGYDVPEKTTVAINMYSIMRDPNVWEDPNTFRPERFLVSSKQKVEGTVRKGDRFNFVPFGGGRRGCPGSLLAFTLINSSIAAMVQCINWKVGDEDGAGVDMEPGIGLTMGMANPLVCLPEIHFNPFDSF